MIFNYWINFDLKKNYYKCGNYFIFDRFILALLKNLVRFS